MYRFCLFACLILLFAAPPVMADSGAAPVDPPKVEGMVTTPPAPSEEAVELPKEAEGLPDYRGAQKPKAPEVPGP